MNTVTPLVQTLGQRLRDAIVAALPDAADVSEVDPLIRPSDRADYQANGVLPLAKRLGVPPRDLAAKVATLLENDDLIVSCEASGPGFLNITLADSAILGQLVARSGAERLGVGLHGTGKATVVDYSQPNIAKEMHVGHLRSTIIGDAVARILEFLGTKVIRQNHLGDWGTQFGMLIQHQLEDEEANGFRAASSGVESISRLNALYRAARARFDGDPEFADRSRRRVVELQAGDERTLAGWQEIVRESKVYFNEVYDRLDVLLTDDDAVGESFYNPFLSDVVTDMEQRGIAVRSDGALCVFFDDIRSPDDKPVPLIIQKSDGGFGYATTDLAAIRYRVGTLDADRVLYVVDSRQALHFRMVFEAARRAGYLTDGVEAVHVSFGSVLGKDGKPFKTRAGETVRLISLLDEAVTHAKATVQERDSGLDAEALDQLSREIGIGAVKYADLSTSRTRDYVFDIDRMVSLNGNTGVYLQYAHARIRSLLRRGEAQHSASAVLDTDVALEPAERALLIHLDELSSVLDTVVETYEPHRLCAYLYALAQAFTTFYEACPVLRAPNDTIRANRLAIAQATGDTLKLGLGLLGIAAPDRL
ncbi:arginine--tRNA ligase [Actinoalloteichus fjordicus]|uniref:Arginine--tRNA ligase n=1 Tax=Actinoalloteichus fjordicus TaxID=1612552 RepID=A0AAC9LC51_9PSEU|nr:arginine--tRNA ligase [Actinoalloteichus fjordicus]APU15258.1 arginyl-tRNA synthetase [Actinoalloteichus fjordicus]